MDPRLDPADFMSASLSPFPIMPSLPSLNSLGNQESYSLESALSSLVPLSHSGTHWAKPKPGFNPTLPTPHLHPGSSVGLEKNTQPFCRVLFEIHDEFQVPLSKATSGKHTNFSCPLTSHSFKRLLSLQLLFPHPHTQPMNLPPVALGKLKELKRLLGLA